ncbi:hypothetical protein BdWA1_002989 [Babesia duncani]|uniref:Uncharacterized protein n=1 Tax=Babesia duncani TaxID=323732 RepID=A0AAD9PI61_9APIC|nr:hypothetical protein BdWA1_002989 [Babesia duncani]
MMNDTQTCAERKHVDVYFSDFTYVAFANSHLGNQSVNWNRQELILIVMIKKETRVDLHVVHSFVGSNHTPLV